MTQYAVTVVAYIHATDPDDAKMIVDQMMDNGFQELLYSSRGESASIVEVSEVTFEEDI
jgi:pentatricopeptide repeat protein